MPRLATKQRVSRMQKYLKLVSDSQGPAPDNPFKRVRTDLGLTLQDVSDECGISRQALIRLEQGVPDKPIERVLNFYLDVGRHQFTYLELVNGYEDYKRNMRVRHRRIFGDMPLPLWFTTSTLSEHPLVLLLNSRWQYGGTLIEGRMNPTEFAKLLCVNQSIVDYFLNKVAQQQSVPKPLLEALRDNGYTSVELSNFEVAYENYRARVTGKVSVSISEPPVGSSNLLDAIKGELGV